MDKTTKWLVRFASIAIIVAFIIVLIGVVILA